VKTAPTHTYRQGDIPDDSFGRRYCACGALETSPRHDTAEPDPAAAALDARVLGEHERSDE
jgi:hypothetical protein